MPAIYNSTLPHIRWMIRRDLPEVLNVEKESFADPWDEEEFVRCLRDRNCIGQVAEVADLVAGFIVYELQKGRIEILDIAVDPAFRNRGIGAALIGRLINKLSRERRREILVRVSEENLAGQLFLKAIGFRCIQIERGYWQPTADISVDAYLMRFHVSQISEIEEPTAG